MNNQEIIESISLYLARTDIHVFSLILQGNKQLLRDTSFRKFFDSLLQSSPIGQYIIEYSESSDQAFKHVILEEVIDYIQSDKEYLLYKLQKEVRQKIGSLEMDLNYYYTRHYVTEQSPAYITEVTRLEKMNMLISELLHFNHQLAKYQLLLGEWKTTAEVSQGFLGPIDKLNADQQTPAQELQEDSLKQMSERGNQSSAELFEFRRKLVGGFIMGAAHDGGNIFVQEPDVKRLGLENGDKLAVVVKPFGHEYVYDYHIVVKTEDPETDRVQFDYCFAEKINGQFCVRHRYTGNETVPISMDGQNLVLYLGEQDVINKRIQDGDLINIAFYRNNTEHVRVLWKHPNR
ncbi:hypothetical protein ERICIV_01815 [Paenibacillus larvae subsp. larvae]|uniref:Uncharacterized protein n=1 Tax=Paenibacillus larvae subsp. larvae TaxID=147375 RepID=A0A2L1UCT4_9BACL|nr:hypothetical protein [Paenibacillus larvae]AQZ48041.1 hypothetical protein B5S25_17085 [Paenibacillus larvae subsp. pulvifaciens]AVF25970.1 hypothetical protein ERICIII_01794 [Paenibacillus larvae subsp. larvae]AVF30747.1 hypothetical protein ERICIV_01815 [Paenibacillus larvae subsp. larvae]MBH0341781.1 hypothetical protein [Paenibacillus larvae]MCY7520974.1 hypothetical protein [Paenibacillus larvae]